MLYLVRSDSDTADFCHCKPGPVDAPYRDPQSGSGGGADGLGWMFQCATCRKGFDIAIAREVPGTLLDLAKVATPRTRQLYLQNGTLTTQTLFGSPADWLAVIEPMLASIPGGLVAGQEYVYFDGYIFPRRHGPVRFKGWSRDHNLPDLPHLADPPLGDVLTSFEYWDGEALETVLRRLKEEYEAGISRPGRPWWKRLWPFG